MKLLFLITLIFVSGCSGMWPKGTRSPASQLPVISSDLYESTGELRDFFKQSKLDPKVCEEALRDTYHFLAGLESDYFRTDYNVAEYGVMMERLWEVRIDLRSHMKHWSASKPLSATCSRAIKDITRAIRYLDDYVGLQYIRLQGQNVSGFERDDKTAMFSHGFPWTMQTSRKFDSKTELKTGDVLLWRSTTTVSAAIARIGDVQNSFAHLSMIYVDPKTKKRYNVESLIETGLIVTEFDEAKLHPGVSKLVVYRHKDAKVSERAGQYIYELARKNKAPKKRLRYDFNFNLHDHKTVFCSEVVHMAFAHASSGKINLPTYLTLFDMKNRNFLKSLGADIMEAFQPGDIELERDFELVAEWRNFHHAKYNHLMDAIFMSMYRWMDDYDYNFKWTFRGNILGNLVFGLRHTPLIGLMLKDQLSDNMSNKTISMVISADLVATTIHRDMVKRLNKKSKSRIYSFRELLEELEAYRREDLVQYQDQMKANKRGETMHDPRFHHRFGPVLR